MFVAHGALMGAQQPALGSDAVDAGHQFRRGLLLPADNCADGRSLPFSTRSNRASRRYAPRARLDVHERQPSSSILFMRSGRYPAHPLERPLRSMLCFSGFGPAGPLRARPSSFHRLPLSPQIPFRPHHRTPHFVQPGPSRFVPVEPQHSLQSQSAGSGFLGGDPPLARNHNGKGLRVS